MRNMVDGSGMVYDTVDIMYYNDNHECVLYGCIGDDCGGVGVGGEDDCSV